jgi:hypothetical protein
MLSSVIILIAFLSAATVMAQYDAPPVLVDSALAQVGLTAADVRFDQDEMATWQGDLWQLDYFTLYHRHPFKLPSHAELTLAELGERVADPEALLAWAGRRIDTPIRRSLIGDPLEKYNVPSDSFPLFSITGKRNLLLSREYACLRRQIDIFYRVVDDKESYFRQAVEPIDKDKYREHLLDFFVYDSTVYLDEIVKLATKLDMGRLQAGIQEITIALQRLTDSVRSGCPFPDRVTRIKTGRGDIYVGTADDDVYEFISAPLLIVDGGGNDIYRFPGKANGVPVRAIVDIGGDDIYECPDTTLPGVGGAICGFAAVIDLEGDDRYEGWHIAQGAGLFGAGCLVDLAGNDVYSGRFLCQGAAAFGVGVLADSSGTDSLICSQMAQGFGNTRGCGVAVNRHGDDVYIARDDTLFSPSSQTPDHNNSLAQGVGFGRRADFLDGHSWAGGVGVLCDVEGNDSYSAGLFAQGCAYWVAVGMLLDGGGDDQYDGVWYVQGAGAHFGVGYFDDFSGRDSYTATHNMAVGAGHDFTIGYFNERDGDDSYTVPNLSLGGGNANGIGIFHDHRGNDSYLTTANSTTLGRANPLIRGARGRLVCLGIFVDGGGDDLYREDWAANGTRWIGPPRDSTSVNPVTIGVGIDYAEEP